MTQKNLNVLMMMDVNFKPPEDHDYSEYLKTEEWIAEKHVIQALETLGHNVKLFGVFDEIVPFIEEIQSHPPDLVFNMCEAFKDNRDYEPHMVALLELFDLKYTGARPAVLRMCKDKGLTKKILSYHRISVPDFVISRRSRPIRSLKKLDCPVFIKPLGFESSEGIAQMSLAETEQDGIERVKYLHSKFDCDVIIEEYIEGRELYVGVYGNNHLTVLPPWELFFKQVPDDVPKFATYKAKWDEKYRKKWGIKSGPAKGLSEAEEARLGKMVKKIYKLLQLEGYARIDLRMRPNGEFVFIEANPNPSIVKTDEFATSAKAAGIEYPDLIAKLIHLSLS